MCRNAVHVIYLYKGTTLNTYINAVILIIQFPGGGKKVPRRRGGGGGKVRRGWGEKVPAPLNETLRTIVN